uniref:Putative methyltransferase n=1 Tax=viral metagenome TaxID=1070528 RepID=A0A6M3J102_9ZZZZ
MTLDFILNKYKIEDKGLIKLNVSRWGTLPKLFRELGYTLGAELGVFKGRFAKFLCKENGNLKLYAIDPWKVYAEYPDHENQDYLDSVYAEARTRLKPYNCQIVIDTSKNALKRFDDRVLDFVYIDANHQYEYVKEDIREWSKKVKHGGIISGHDYVNGHNGISFGIRQAVDEWVRDNNISHLIILNKDANVDQMPSWMFVNP